MVHTICTSAADGELEYFERLWDSLLAPGVDLGSKIEELFAVETEAFDLEHAFFSRIDPDAQTQRFAIAYGPHGTMTRGRTVPLSRSYCRKTVEDSTGTMAISDALAEGWADDPAYDEFGLGSYLGTTVTVDGEPYGTLCFASTEPREEPIADEEVALVEMHGRWVTYELSQWTDPPSMETIGGIPVETGVASVRIDRMLEIMAREARRYILLTLLDDAATETGIDVIERAMDGEHVEVQLYHTHLPKLEQAGYIEWQPGSNSISRGPKYSEIEPLLRLLEEYTTGFSV